MSIPNYGVLVGTLVDKMDSPTASKKNPQSQPHFQVLLEANSVKYRIAINVRSETNPPDLQVYMDDNYQHPILEGFSALPQGFHPLESHPGFQALDFIRENLFPLDQMQVIPAIGTTSGNDLNDLLNLHLEQALRTPGSLIYAFGSKWPDDSKPDPYFDFEPGIGVHDIHMNQGNTGHFAKDNGPYQDGALFIYYPDEKRYSAWFAKFQSQIVHTDNVSANPIQIPLGQKAPEHSNPVRIFAALINPKGNDQGQEKVYLINIGADSISLDGWILTDKNQNQEKLIGNKMDAGEVLELNLSGDGVQLSNRGGIITLKDSSGAKISGVSYTQDQIPEPGFLLLF